MQHKLVIVRKFSDLKRREEDWYDLWQRTVISTPTVLLDQVELHLERFHRRFQAALLVEDEAGRLVAGMVLTDGGRRFGFRKADLANKCWQDCSELLIDHCIDYREPLKLLADGFACIGVSVIEFNAVRVGRICWRQLLGQLHRRFGFVQETSRYESAIIPQMPWDQHLAKLSKNIRKSVRRRERRLLETGTVDFEIVDHADWEKLRQGLENGFNLEMRSWKGTSGRAILKNEGATKYLLDQAESFAKRGWLRVHNLYYNQELVAFDYGWLTRGVYHSFKTTYDEKYSSHSPGQILLAKVLEHYAGQSHYHGTDIMGISSKAVDVWLPEYVPVADLVVPVTPAARKFLQSYEAVKANPFGKMVYGFLKGRSHG